VLDSHEIARALNASRVVDLYVASAHGPLGLEHLARVIEDLQAQPTSSASNGPDVLTIQIKTETRKKLEQLATAQLGKKQGPVSAADIAAAIVEHFVASAAG
jgi:hypothetical protein